MAVGCLPPMVEYLHSHWHHHTSTYILLSKCTERIYVSAWLLIFVQILKWKKSVQDQLPFTPSLYEVIIGIPVCRHMSASLANILAWAFRSPCDMGGGC